MTKLLFYPSNLKQVRGLYSRNLTVFLVMLEACLGRVNFFPTLEKLKLLISFQERKIKPKYTNSVFSLLNAADALDQPEAVVFLDQAWVKGAAERPVGRAAGTQVLSALFSPSVSIWAGVRCTAFPLLLSPCDNCSVSEFSFLYRLYLHLYLFSPFLRKESGGNFIFGTFLWRLFTLNEQVRHCINKLSL